MEWLSARRNQLVDVKPLVALKALRVLNLSENSIVSLAPLKSLVGLCALIVNDNKLLSIEGLHKMTALNTLVISGNPIESLHQKTFASLTSLTRLSASKTKLAGLPSDGPWHQMTQLRFNGCRFVAPPPVLQNCARLQLLDLGNNRLPNLTALFSLITGLRGLHHLTLVGNPCTKGDQYKSEVAAALPRIRSLDSKKLVPAAHGDPQVNAKRKFMGSKVTFGGAEDDDEEGVPDAAAVQPADERPAKRRREDGGAKAKRAKGDRGNDK